MNNEYIVDLDAHGDIPDNIILATDETGDELLRFGIRVESDRWVKCRYPTWGQWDRYLRAVHDILSTFGAECEDVRLPDNLADSVLPKQTIKLWAVIQAAILTHKGMSRKVENAFHEFLRPSVDGVPARQLRAWIRDNAPITLVFSFFAALLRPEQWVKKKAQEVLLKGFQRSITPISLDTFTKSSDGMSAPSQEQAPLGFI
jgi:hypothetical protein